MFSLLNKKTDILCSYLNTKIADSVLNNFLMIPNKFIAPLNEKNCNKQLF